MGVEVIVSREEKPMRKIEIDLCSPEGNAMYLLGMVGLLGKRLGWSLESIDLVRKLMMMGDYEHLLGVFDYHFGELVILYK